MSGRRPPRLQASEHRLLLAAGDLVVGVVAVFVSIGLWTITAGVPLSEALAARAWWFSAALAWAAGLAPSRRGGVAWSMSAVAASIARLAAAFGALYLAVYFYAPRQALPRLLAMYAIWEASLLTLAWRLVSIWALTHAALRRRWLVAGAGPAGEAVARALADGSPRNAEVVGFLDGDSARHGTAVAGLPVVGGYDMLPDGALEMGVSRIIVAARPHETTLVNRLLACQEAEIEVVPMAAAYEQALMRVPAAHVAPDWLFTSFAESVSARDASHLAKRALDLAGGLFGSIVLLLLAGPIALAIKTDSRGPVFYRQMRAGRGGRPFALTKFRTMVWNAEEEGEPRWAGPRDPRITRTGRWLRRTRLDELPNVLSVLRGDMSLVGPRPERPEFVEALEREVPLYRARLIARPGLTGWAQINYPYGNSVADAAAKLEFDLYYLKHRSFLFDAWILLRTVGTVLSFRGR